MTPDSAQARCFMAMPVTTRPDDAARFSDPDHWTHVMESLFERAIALAGFEPVRPVALGSHLIHGEIIRQLSTAELVLVDLSTHNPNVFFELGVRTSLNLPVALVRDEHTDLPFDTAGINTYTYDSNLRGWEIEAQQERLAEHIRNSVESCNGQNPLWRQFGLTITAQQPNTAESPLEAKVDLLGMQLMQLQEQIMIDRSIGERQLAEVRSWSAHQLSDPSRNSPSELFAVSARRLAKEDGCITHVDILSPTSAVVSIEGRPTPAFFRRLEELADRYEVNLELMGRFEDVAGAQAGRTATGTSKNVMKEFESHPDAASRVQRRMQQAPGQDGPRARTDHALPPLLGSAPARSTDPLLKGRSSTHDSGPRRDA